MANIFLNSAEQGIVVFKVWQSLTYKKRILLSSALILTGLVLQILSKTLLPGVVLVFFGNLFLLPSGYDNRVKIGRYNPKAGWEEVGESKLTEFLQVDRKIRKWDRSSMDITNGLGFFTFLILVAALFILFLVSLEDNNKPLEIISVNGALLLVPFWITGVRSKFRLLKVTRKIDLILKLLSEEEVQARLKPHDADYYFLMGGEKETKVPVDVKFRVNIENRHPDFLGLYGQIVLNNVQNTSYPYFYVVIVARRNFGLDRVYKNYVPDKTMVKEYKIQSDVEVLVIRQKTTKAKGYYTKDKQVLNIFSEGLRLAEQAA
ncbi:MAG: hypothetical protein KAT34_16600, partial [Candidatus Aminicenantes bacterium]|nr:hypothetical protein [Candidatus Aminicenantes bacterium]